MTDIIIATCKNREEVQPMIDEIRNNTPEEHRIIATCQPLSASKNRNFGLSFANSEIIVMLDDDITGFYEGWLTDLLKLFEEKNVILVSARLLDKNGKTNDNMGMRWKNEIEDKKVTTAAVAFRKNDLMFDEEFINSGYEDTDFMLRLGAEFPDMKFVIANNCRLIHLNEMKGQNDLKSFEHNRKYFISKHPGKGAENQRQWTK